MLQLATLVFQRNVTFYTKNIHCAQLAEIGQIASKLSVLDAKRSRLPKIVVTFMLQSGKTHLAQVNYCLDGVSQSFDNHQ